MRVKNWYITVFSVIMLVGCGGQEPTPPASSVVTQLPRSAKRGVAFNFSQAEDLPLLTAAISWDYNWGNDQNSLAATWMDEEGVDFCPMCWSNNYNADRIRAYVKAHPKTQYLLGYNEPNLTDQARMTPAQAAAQWDKVVALAKELNLKLVSPAMNYGTLSGYNDPIKWLDEFFSLVNTDDIYAISIHCYMASPQAVKDYISRFYKYNKPIWLTEFCAWEEYAIHSEEDQMKYMCQVLNYLEQDPHVERYAWFIPRGSGPVDSYPYMQLLSKKDIGALSPQGEVYAGLTSFDRTIWLPSDAPILPNTYCDCSAAETIRNGSFAAAPHLRPTTDNAGVLMMTTFTNGQWVEYQINAVNAIQKMVIRYQGVVGSSLTVLVDGTQAAQTQLAWNEGKWAEQEFAISIPQGHHTVRLVSGGNITFNWFKLQ